jgi:hypothetical protein
VGVYESTDTASPFLITQAVSNRGTLIYQEFQICLKTDRNNLGEPEQRPAIETERDIYQKIDKICGQPVKQRVMFYQ